MSPIILNIKDEVIVEAFTVSMKLQVDLSFQENINRNQLEQHQQKVGMLVVMTEALAMNKNSFLPVDYFPQ